MILHNVLLILYQTLNSRYMTLLNKYIWLFDVIRRSGEIGILFNDISQKWNIEFGDTLSKRTFHHQKSRVEELFDTNILCNRCTNRYTIESTNSINGDELRSWILDSFSLSNTLLESQNLRDRILIEHQPSSLIHLLPLIEAMKNNNIVAMKYHSFKYEHPTMLSLAPYFVKQYGNRWYLYGVEVGKSKLKLYALDRIKMVKSTEEQFELPLNFSANDTLFSAFGVTRYDDVLPTTITICTYDNKAKYLDTLPLHHSQRKIDDNTYELYVAPTSEFISEMVHQGENIEIISPISVREQVIQRIKLIQQRYGKKSNDS